MSLSSHTFGQTCHLARDITPSASQIDDKDVPYLKPQYFYYATYSVDDPLSAIPITSGSESKPNQYPPLPFSARDNNALEEAWTGVALDNLNKDSHDGKTSNVQGEKGNRQHGRPSGSDGRTDNPDLKPRSPANMASRELKGRNTDSRVPSREGDVDPISTSGRSNEGFPSTGRFRGRTRGDTTSSVGKTFFNTLESDESTSTKNLVENTLKKATMKNEKGPSHAGTELGNEEVTKAIPVDIKVNNSRGRDFGSESVSSSFQGNAGTTGRPFVKLPERSTSPRPTSSRLQDQNFKSSRQSSSTRSTHVRDTTETVTDEAHQCKFDLTNNTPSDVPVGISRLYLVELPYLLMKPIYWAHVHDTAPVIRATWFYKESMLPVEPLVANQLEMGYRELRPWSQTWKDELTSAVEVGASGEEKIAHRLWPKDDKPNPKRQLLSADPFCAAICFQGEASAVGSLEEETTASGAKTIKKKFLSSQVIYKDGKTAFILKPNLQPSAYYGRKPLQKIRRGRGVGIEVIRGFDRAAWEKLHPPKRPVPPKVAAKVPISGDAATANADFCPACKVHDESPNVTDLCLVIHGIGQKLSERVESFNFTHACNSVRRSVNVELGTDAVKKVLRKDLGGIMVLPVNWRSNLSFEDGGPKKAGDKEAVADFTLKEITPDTIPAVRNLISDVMLDIPFYMSHHKEKMIQAVVREANRVYRLWCQNNPNFHEYGRVHVIAHSLGSPMTLEILSRQPTEVEPLDLTDDSLNLKHFDFNTTNLFCAGSPAGFFLLLQNSKLVPRRGREKPGADLADDQDRSIVGEAGTFGCLAIDNIYNIMHCNDPIAYRLNATVDPQYASSLKEALVPSATTGFFEGIGNAMRYATPGLAPPVDLAVGQVVKPGALPRLPSQLEMEIHDFTREEIAEKKFYLLNDNCQIDWLLSSGGGPFDIAYLDMLGAHSSYWEKKEFIRLLVTEVGREPGKRTTLPNMRAQKKTYKV